MATVSTQVLTSAAPQPISGWSSRQPSMVHSHHCDSYPLQLPQQPQPVMVNNSGESSSADLTPTNSGYSSRAPVLNDEPDHPRASETKSELDLLQDLDGKKGGLKFFKRNPIP